MSQSRLFAFNVVISGNYPNVRRSDLVAALRKVGIFVKLRVDTTSHVLFDLGARSTKKRQAANELKQEGFPIDLMGRADLELLLTDMEAFMRTLSPAVHDRLFPIEWVAVPKISIPARPSAFSMTF